MVPRSFLSPRSFMLNPRDSSRPPARSSKQSNEDRKPTAVTWVRPEKPPPKSAMLQNRKLDQRTPKRSASRRP
jgi:hypothetical protein